MRLHPKHLGLAIAASAVLILPVADAFSAPRMTDAVPVALLGTWTRTVKHVDVGTSVTAGSRFTITIKKDGTLDMKTSDHAFGNWVGTIWGAGTGRLRMEIIVPPLQYYRWHVAKQRLTISVWPGHANFVDHDAIFLGTWRALHGPR
jgi:hypothetical protein